MTTVNDTKRTAPEDCADMDAVRAEIDRIDGALVELLAERWRYVDRIWRLKSNPEEATVPWRIEQVIERVRARAEEADMPADLAEMLWRRLIAWGIQYEEEMLRAEQGETD